MTWRAISGSPAAEAAAADLARHHWPTDPGYPAGFPPMPALSAAAVVGAAAAGSGAGAGAGAAVESGESGSGGGGQRLTLVPFSAQPKPFWSHLPVSPSIIDWGEIMHPTYLSKCADVEPESRRA